MNKATLRLVLSGLLGAGRSLVLTAQRQSPSAPKPDPRAPMRPLIGQWEGEAHGEPGTGRAEICRVLRNRFIEVRNQSTCPPQEKNPKGEAHQNQGMPGCDRDAKKIGPRRFDREGFVNHCVLDSATGDGRTAVFVTTAIENIPPGWRRRETCTSTSADEFTEKFAPAEPGKDFAPYSETHFRRKAR